MTTTASPRAGWCIQDHDIRIADARRRTLRENSPLSEDDVRAIRIDQRSLAMIGDDFDIGKTAVARIKQRKTFAWVPDDPAKALQEPLFIDVGVPLAALDAQTAALVLQVDARACHCGDCIITNMHANREGRAVAKLHGWDVRIARVLCAITHDLPLWSSSWETRHVCGNPACVNPNHLMPGTSQENADDAVRHGTVARGESIGASKLTTEQAQWVIATAETESAADAALRVGLNTRQIQSIRQGFAWTHLQSNQQEKTIHD